MFTFAICRRASVCRLSVVCHLSVTFVRPSGGSRGGSLGSDEPPIWPNVVVENARTAWLYQSSSVTDIFTEIVPQLYTT